jgi:uridine kinase
MKRKARRKEKTVHNRKQNVKNKIKETAELRRRRHYRYVSVPRRQEENILLSIPIFPNIASGGEPIAESSSQHSALTSRL